MIRVTSETGEQMLVNEQRIDLIATDEEGVTEIYCQGLCIPVKETVEEILAIIERRFN